MIRSAAWNFKCDDRREECGSLGLVDEYNDFRHALEAAVTVAWGIWQSHSIAAVPVANRVHAWTHTEHPSERAISPNHQFWCVIRWTCFCMFSPLWDRKDFDPLQPRSAFVHICSYLFISFNPDTTGRSSCHLSASQIFLLSSRFSPLPRYTKRSQAWYSFSWIFCQNDCIKSISFRFLGRDKMSRANTKSPFLPFPQVGASQEPRHIV